MIGRKPVPIMAVVPRVLCRKLGAELLPGPLGMIVLAGQPTVAHVAALNRRLSRPVAQRLHPVVSSSRSA